MRSIMTGRSGKRVSSIREKLLIDTGRISVMLASYLRRFLQVEGCLRLVTLLKRFRTTDKGYEKHSQVPKCWTLRMLDVSINLFWDRRNARVDEIA